MTLNDEQIHNALDGNEPADLNEADRQTLRGHRALRDRLRGCFADVAAPAGLADRIRGATEAAINASAGESRVYRMGPWLRSGLAAAAVLVLALALPYVFVPQTPIQAAQPQLVHIHEQNLAHEAGFMPAEDPCRVADHMAAETGHRPRMPDCEAVNVVGCRVGRLWDRAVGTYLVETADGPVSLVVTADPPEKLALRLPEFTDRDVTFHPCKTDRCNILAVRIGDLTYVAVGQVDHDTLQAVLLALL